MKRNKQWAMGNKQSTIGNKQTHEWGCPMPCAMHCRINNLSVLLALILFIAMSCNSNKETNKKIQLITLDPGHFHAALVQKTMYPDVDSIVHVYAPTGNDLQLHLARITGYNNRKENPTV